MQQNFDEIQFLVGTKEILEEIISVPSKEVFDKQILSFLGELSKMLLEDKDAKEYPDVISYAFWIRNSSIKRIAEQYDDAGRRLGRGISFHITPSNIPVQFAVSMTYGLLSGNVCVIRLSDKEFEQVNIICNCIRRLLNDKYKELSNYIVLMRYGYNEDITAFFSSICDARIIWGGNETIRKIHQYPIPLRAIELDFADRYSIAVISSDEYLKMNKKVIAKDFYLDTYWVDQNACSSPRLIVWTGNEIDKAKDEFWKFLHDEVEKQYAFEAIYGSDKLLNFTKIAMDVDNVKLKRVFNDNYIYRIEVPNITSTVMEYKGSMGYFIECDVQKLEEMIPLFTKECQTVLCCGIAPESIRDLVCKYGVRGVDRIVPMGHALEFSVYWDGFDMIRELSRLVYI